jgi:formamidopyrimidine-DNA glycosylase
MNRLRRRTLKALHGAIVAVLSDAVQSAENANSGPGDFREGETLALAVYDREGEPCLACRRKIQRIQQGGRSTYYCPGCQR